MRSVASQPALTGPEMARNTDSLLIRRRTTTNKLFTDFQQSPLHDLNPIAQPGLTTRVTRNNTVGTSLDLIGEPWSPGNAEVMTVEGGYTPGLIAAAGTSVVGALLYGFHLGNMNSAATAMRADLGIPGGINAPTPEEGVANDTAWGFCVSIFCLGALLGCSVVAPIADTIGRRRTILFKLIIFMLGSLLEAASVLPAFRSTPCIGAGIGFFLMLGGRAVCGVACGATTVVVPMYLGEISPPHLRGALGTYFQLTCCTGILLAQILGLPAVFGHGHWWSMYLLLPLIPSGCQLLLQDRIVESPRWLASRSDKDAMQAQAVLAHLRGEEVDSLAVIQELDMMQMGSTVALGAPSGGQGIGRMLMQPKTRKALVICMVCAIAQQFSGINNIFNFSTIFLTDNGISSSTVALIAVLMNFGNVGITVVSVELMDRTGRRALLQASTIGMIISLLALTLALSEPGQPWTPPLAVASVVSFVMSFGIGMGPVPWLLPAELFSADSCAKGAAVSAGTNWLANFVVGQAFLPLANLLKSAVFLPFALILCAFYVFTQRKVPETRGKTLEQILLELA